MSLNKTLARFFDEVRREAKRNPAFADRLDAVLQAHESRRDVSDEALTAASSEAPEAAPAAAAGIAPPAPTINPVGYYQREGAEALHAVLSDPAIDAAALRALVEEHNLDPGGEAEGLDKAGLVAHIVAHAERRAKRDSALFNY
ncbi:MAG: hypothetical protein AB7L65_05210 [Hyphomonadaceae bacterium]